MYRTGDLGKTGENGELYFLGRKDRQFKHLGHRIEPEEIEQKASLLDGVEECVCTYNAARKAICLFYKGTATPKEISLFLRAELPSFMAPRKLTAMDELPRLPNGKLDRKKLEEMTQGK
jgi:acyl-coenzyme A synthetase/AMP-(fatty) acid ligase